MGGSEEGGKGVRREGPGAEGETRKLEGRAKTRRGPVGAGGKRREAPAGRIPRSGSRVPRDRGRVQHEGAGNGFRDGAGRERRTLTGELRAGQGAGTGVTPEL